MARRAVVVAFGLAAAFPWAGLADELPKIESVAGQLLVAARGMPDGRFAHTVIYMVRHDETGAMGVVVNRSMGDVPIASLLEGLGLESDDLKGEIRVHYGGPVENGRGFVLHSADYVDDGMLAVTGGFALSMSAEIVRDIAAGKGPRRALLVFGYAGWAPGQLEAEMMRNDWVIVPADESLVFDGDDEEKWRRAMERRGLDL